MKNVLNKLFKIQQELKVPKNQRNTFGNYNYRNCEDIMEASKPLCAENNCLLTCSDEIVVFGEHNPYLYEEKYYDKDLKKENTRTNSTGQQRFYVQATATLYDLDSDESISVTAYAREEETKKGMDVSQITGASSSYARKYALNGLLQLDDNKDADTDEYKKQQGKGKQEKSSTEEEKPSTEEEKPSVEMITEEQVELLHVLLAKLNNEEAKQKLYEKFKIKSSKELTKKNATTMIDFLKKKVGE